MTVARFVECGSPARPSRNRSEERVDHCWIWQAIAWTFMVPSRRKGSQIVTQQGTKHEKKAEGQTK